MKTSSNLLISIFIFVFTTQSFAQTPIPGGEVSGTWTKAGSPYLIQGEIGIESGQTLMIEPGVTVEFQGHYKFLVAGTLLAEGLINDTIFFTIHDSTGWHDMGTTNGGWHGFKFGLNKRGADSTRFRYCVFAFGKAIGTVFSDKSGGAIGVHQYSDLVVRNCNFFMNAAHDNGGAIAASGANISLIENQYWHCKAYNGGAIALSSSQAEISKSYFVDNRASNSGGGIALYLNSYADIRTNLMAGNFADYGGAIQCMTNCNPIIQNNLMYSNVAYQEGGAADLEDNCQATFINNTIVGNFALFGGGIDVEVNSSPEFRNCILWDNTAFVDGPQIHLFSEDSDPDFYYCDIEGGTDSIGLWYGGSVYLEYTGIYENNIDQNPDFMTYGNYYYLLNDGSPCIDTGDPNSIYNDLENPGNPGYALWPSKGTIRNDMGCHGGPYPLNLDITTAIDETDADSPAVNSVDQFNCFPNPASESCNIAYRNHSFQHISIKVLDLTGREVAYLLNEEQKPGEYIQSFNTDHLPAGIYFCHLKAANQSMAIKLIIP